MLISCNFNANISLQSEIRDYIAYFEPLVVYALNQFPYTSSLLLQQRVLFLVVQLMHLKVYNNYYNNYVMVGMYIRTYVDVMLVIGKYVYNACA